MIITFKWNKASSLMRLCFFNKVVIDILQVSKFVIYFLHDLIILVESLFDPNAVENLHWNLSSCNLRKHIPLWMETIEFHQIIFMLVEKIFYLLKQNLVVWKTNLQHVVFVFCNRVDSACFSTSSNSLVSRSLLFLQAFIYDLGCIGKKPASPSNSATGLDIAAPFPI